MTLKTGSDLFHSYRHLADACLDHPFVQGIAGGDLSRDSFKFYIGQDAFFLESFARAYALALAKAPDSSAMYTFLELLEGALEELRLHRNYAEKWEIELAPEPASTTRAYTDFLLRVAWSESVDCIMAAMMPCMRLYSYLGQALKHKVNPESPYREWVETYSTDDFESLAGKLEELFDEYTTEKKSTGRAEIYYRTAMELELAFFQQAYEHNI